MALTTVANCKAFRGVDSLNTEHDAELTRLIPAVQAFLEEECLRRFDTATFTEYVHGDDWRDRLLVANPPIVSVTNLYDDPTRAYATALSASAYAIDDADAGLIRLLDGLTFSKGLRNIKVVYVGGYSSIPKDLEQAAIELVWACREKGINNLLGVRSRSVADGNVQFVNLDWGSMNLDPIIRKYRLWTGMA